MAKRSQPKTQSLLASLIADFPRRKQDAESLLAAQGMQLELSYQIDPPKLVKRLATFDKSVYKDLSPMLAERYQFAACITRAFDIWPAASEVAKLIRSQDVQTTHIALRENWEESAPWLFPDQSLSLFGYNEDVPENIIYLAWPGDIEPEVFEYFGQGTRHFPNLDEYLKWCLRRP